MKAELERFRIHRSEVTKGKEKTFRGRSTGTQRSVKKAYVSLPADAKLDLSADMK